MIKNSSSWKNIIIDLLNEVGTKACIDKAKELQSGNFDSGILHLRQLGLEKKHVKSLCEIFRNENELSSLKSISLSYNREIADEGAILIIQNLPKTIKEIGMVACGMTDKAGSTLLERVKELMDLKMICIENNSFSDEMKQDFLDLQKTQPGLAVFI